FDAALFGISPREAVFMDPQHRLFLETVWATVENAGYRPGALAGRDIGVFVGCQLQEYLGLIGDAGEAKAQAVLGNTPTMLANRVSFLFDWRGPSQTIDTACSSALVAVHRAMRALRDGECAWAIAGGAHLLLSPETYVLGSQLGMLSPDGRCKTFDQSANGYVKGEGVGAVLLKPLDQAEADGDHIQAVILASAENHGGRAHFLTAPNPEAQARLLVAAYTQADVSPETVSYIEAHGTGTELGDPIEVEALNRAFGELATRRGQPLPTAYCGLGSVKSNMGHLEPAAGIAGLLKVVLALRHQQLPATLHIRQVNPYLNLEGSPFYLVTQTRDWLPLHDANGQSLPRRAGVSSFGFGGSNAHLVLEECAEDVVMPTASLPPAIFPLSARSEPALRALAERLVVELRAQTDGLSRRWRDVLFTLQTGREAWPERLALVADSLAEGLNGLERWLKGELDAARIFQGRASTVAAELTLFDSSDELHAFARAELAKGRWDKIARLWAAGAALDWTQLGSNGRRLPLPGVPFADTRYWFNHRRGESVALTPNLSPTRQGEPEIPSTNAAELSAEFPSLSKEGWRTAPGWFDPAPLRARLRTLLADALYLPEDAIDDETPFVEMGLDSILAVELVNRLNKELGSDFKATRLYDHGTINALANYLAEHLLTVTSSPPDALPTDAGSGARAVDVANVQEEVTPEPIVAPSLPASASPEQEEQDRATAAVLGQLRLLLARLLYLDPADLDDDLELLELGLDTVSAGQLSRLIADTLGVELPAPRLLGYSGLATLAADIVAQREGTGSREQGQSEMELPCEIPPDPPFAKEGGECLASSIAIIGMAGRFPGAPDLDTFWQNLAQGVDAIREVPPERWDLTTCYDPDGRRPNSTYCRHGGFLENIDRFDPLFFNIAPQEAEVMDPQQRLFLEEAWKALEDAGYSDQALTNSRCAIYVGAGQGDYFMHSLGHDGLPVAQFGMGSVNSILAARLAYWLNLKGAAVALDTACSSSLVAVHLACRALQDGDCDLALAGGVSLMTTPQMHILTSQSQMLSPEGRCKTFANDADGFVPGEAVGALVLKPLEAALRDGDHIYGV
ncbi:MAG: 6-methylsalicylic acid synthase, partial [Candidatus Competibacteraceae bacterium]|nr:6-methylsalicylic acid synthase [Candidatus Competibacteraceae bacterium]